MLNRRTSLLKFRSIISTLVSYLLSFLHLEIGSSKMFLTEGVEQKGFVVFEIGTIGFDGMETMLIFEEIFGESFGCCG